MYIYIYYIYTHTYIRISKKIYVVWDSHAHFLFGFCRSEGDKTHMLSTSEDWWKCLRRPCTIWNWRSRWLLASRPCHAMPWYLGFKHQTCGYFYNVNGGIMEYNGNATNSIWLIDVLFQLVDQWSGHHSTISRYMENNRHTIQWNLKKIWSWWWSGVHQKKIIFNTLGHQKSSQLFNFVQLGESL